MLPLLLVLVATQVPAVPGEGTLVSSCKQRMLSACEALRQINPQKAAELERNAQQVLKAAEEAAETAATAAAVESAADAAPEPPNCDGQDHHVISKRIARRLENHATLRGLYEPRDKRFVAKGKDKESHCGYQKWHRDVDDEVIEWLDQHETAKPEEFMRFLREIYRRKDMVERFPHGF